VLLLVGVYLYVAYLAELNLQEALAEPGSERFTQSRRPAG
jgi:hypothetical protein